MGVATWGLSSSLAASAANAFVVCDLVRIATGTVGCEAGHRDERRRTVVQPASSTLGGAAGGTTLGGGAVTVAVGGTLSCFAVGALSACVPVVWSSARRASMAAS